jgi:hypothetical protein
MRPLSLVTGLCLAMAATSARPIGADQLSAGSPNSPTKVPRTIPNVWILKTRQFH